MRGPEKKGSDHKSKLRRLRRIEGQVRGVAGMVEEERYCVDILTQIKAIKSALVGVEIQIMEKHMQHCVHRAIKSGSKKESTEAVDEILALLKRSL